MDKSVQQALIEMREQTKAENEKVRAGLDFYFGDKPGQTEEHYFGRVTH
ncbi:hypothetical protein [Paenibacillus bouchesdurhonensis]|nr:hypothetical protein [Paenibacillus bouchesdurhonensis]